MTSCLTSFLLKLSDTIGGRTADEKKEDDNSLVYNSTNFSESYQNNETNFSVLDGVDEVVACIEKQNIENSFVLFSFEKAMGSFAIALVYCVILSIAISAKSFALIVFASVITMIALWFLLTRKYPPLTSCKTTRELKTYADLRKNQVTAAVCAY